MQTLPVETELHEQEPAAKPAPKMRREVAAGGIVFKRTQRGVVFAMIVDSYGKLAFPKGHVRRGERLVECAAREIYEEMGVRNLRLLRRLGTNDIWFRDRFVYKGYLIHKFIHYYLFETDRHANIRIERRLGGHGEQIKRGLWVPMYDVLKRSSYENMEDIVRQAIRTIERRYHLRPYEGGAEKS
ncbi:NUDIX domain-containing protein [Candidatus Uhrbacteria bacterium]|nr:NUDIX domain-containing protein [Candidatus Uhrbacteria bacterium]